DLPAAGALSSVVARQHLEQLDLENQIRVGRDAAHGALAIAQLRRHPQPALAAHAHAHQADVPALDHPASTDHALERLAAGEGGVELAAIFQGAAVLGGDQRT